MLHSGDLDFSFSGLKTAVLTLIQREPLNEQSRADLAAAIEAAIVEVLIAKSLAALEQSGLRQLVVAGGVGANRKLRDELTQHAAHQGIRVFYPELEFCTDNGAMIAFAGAMRLQQAGIKVSGLKDFSVKPRWDLELPEAVA